MRGRPAMFAAAAISPEETERDRKRKRHTICLLNNVIEQIRATKQEDVGDTFRETKKRLRSIRAKDEHEGRDKETEGDTK